MLWCTVTGAKWSCFWSMRSCFGSSTGVPGRELIGVTWKREGVIFHRFQTRLMNIE